jgi:hypothetical protein
MGKVSLQGPKQGKQAWRAGSALLNDDEYRRTGYC